MIIEETFYAIQCDNCKEICEGSEGYSFCACKDTAREESDNSGWINHEEKHYCDECWTYGDDDEIIIHSNRFNPSKIQNITQ